MIYPYKCSKCSAAKEVWQSLSAYVQSPNIPECCDGKMDRVFTVPMVTPDYQPFVSHLDGTIINSRSAQREHMLRHGVALYDDVAPDLKAKREAVTKAHYADLVDTIYEAKQMVEQGYKPSVDTAEVSGSGEDISGIDVTSSLPKESVESLGA